MILGVDPGSVSAAYGLLDDDGLAVETGDVPVVDRMVDASGWDDLLERLLDIYDGDIAKLAKPTAAVIEQVSAMPKQGVSSSFRFGMGCGLIRGVLATYHVPIIQVAPTRWKRHFNLDSDPEKSRALALRLWPDMSSRLARKKDHGRAEALLLARWYLERQP